MAAMQHTGIIEEATPADFDALTGVWEASVRATHHFLPEQDIQYFKPLLRHQYLYMVKLVCMRNAQGQIVGFAGTAGNRLEMLFIHPDSRGTGVGKALLQYAINNMGITELDVNEQNEQAVGFYRHFGFAIKGRSETDGAGKPYPILHMQRAPKP